MNCFARVISRSLKPRPGNQQKQNKHNTKMVQRPAVVIDNGTG